MSRFFDSWWGAQRDRCEHGIAANDHCERCVEAAVEHAKGIMRQVREDLDEDLEERKLDKILVELRRTREEVSQLTKEFKEFTTPRLTSGYITFSVPEPPMRRMVMLTPPPGWSVKGWQDTLEELSSGLDSVLLERDKESLRKLRLKFKGGFTMPLALQIGQSAVATFNGLDQFGQPFAIDFTAGQYKISWAAADASAIGVVQNADGTATISGVAASTGDALTASVTRPDGVVIGASDSVSVGAPPPPTPVLTSGSISFSAPA